MYSTGKRPEREIENQQNIINTNILSVNTYDLLPSHGFTVQRFENTEKQAKSDTKVSLHDFFPRFF